MGAIAKNAAIIRLLPTLHKQKLRAAQGHCKVEKGEPANGQRPPEPLAIDGKTLRGTIPRGQSQGVHLLPLYSPTQEAVWMQLTVDRKENESAVAPQLLQGQVMASLNNLALGIIRHFRHRPSVPDGRAGGERRKPGDRASPLLPGSHAFQCDKITHSCPRNSMTRLVRRMLGAWVAMARALLPISSTLCSS